MMRVTRPAGAALIFAKAASASGEAKLALSVDMVVGVVVVILMVVGNRKSTRSRRAGRNWLCAEQRRHLEKKERRENRNE